MSEKKRSGTMTAGELMAQLERDPEFQRKRAEREAEYQARLQELIEAQQPIVADLRKVGVDVESLLELGKAARGGASDSRAEVLEVLLEHLESGEHPYFVRDGIVRLLAVTPAASAFWERLCELYLQAKVPQGVAKSEAVAAADVLEAYASAVGNLATKEHSERLLALLSDESLGDSRILLIRPVLRVGGRRGRDLVETLSSDPVLGKEASAMLKLKRWPRF